MEQVNIDAIAAQVQIMDAIISALIQTHPNPTALRSAMQSHISAVIAVVANRAIQKNWSMDITERLRRYGDQQLALLPPV